MATWYNNVLTTVAGLSNLACFCYTKRKFNTQIAQFNLMALDSGISAVCCLGIVGGNLLSEWLESKALGCLANALGRGIAAQCFFALTSLNSYVR